MYVFYEKVNISTKEHGEECAILEMCKYDDDTQCCVIETNVSDTLYLPMSRKKYESFYADLLSVFRCHTTSIQIKGPCLACSDFVDSIFHTIEDVASQYQETEYRVTY